MHRTDAPGRTDLGPLPAYNCAANRDRLYGEQSGDCAGCGTHFQKRNLEVDHIIAVAKGGTDHIDNLQMLCSSCNRIKGDHGMEYLRTKAARSLTPASYAGGLWACTTRTQPWWRSSWG